MEGIPNGTINVQACTAKKLGFMYSQRRNCVTNLRIHVSVSDLQYMNFPKFGPPIFLQKNRQTDPRNI